MNTHILPYTEETTGKTSALNQFSKGQVTKHALSRDSEM